MTKLTEYLSDPGWWLGVVVVGLIINVASVYLIRRLDAQLSRISERWRARSEQARADRLLRVDLIRTSERELFLHLFRELRLRERAVWQLVNGLGFLMLGLNSFAPREIQIASLLAFGLAQWLSQRNLSSASKGLSEIHEAIARRPRDEKSGTNSGSTVDPS